MNGGCFLQSNMHENSSEGTQLSATVGSDLEDTASRGISSGNVKTYIKVRFFFHACDM